MKSAITTKLNRFLLIANLIVVSFLVSSSMSETNSNPIAKCDGCLNKNEVFSPGAIECIDGIKHRCAYKDGRYYWGYLGTTCR
jgi:hypothetical protein